MASGGTVEKPRQRIGFLRVNKCEYLREILHRNGPLESDVIPHISVLRYHRGTTCKASKSRANVF